MVNIQHHRPAVILAPMEGVTDAPMRSVLTELGGFTFCVSEFLRVAQDIPPVKIFHKHIPEIHGQWKTSAETLVQVQLLGGDPEKVGQTAILACNLGAPGVDLNFGCPAPTVNRSDGGATLLKHPHRIKSIVTAVRQAVPSHLPVSVKVRLGWDDPQSVFQNAQMAAEGGASWITIHARTRLQMYAPPVDWKLIGEVRKQIPIPVVANGDIWTLEDFLRCREETGCEHFMLGRGAVVDPFLPARVAKELGIISSVQGDDLSPSIPWKRIIHRYVELSHSFQQIGRPRTPRALCGKIKQWGKMVFQRGGTPWYETIKCLEQLEDILPLIPPS